MRHHRLSGSRVELADAGCLYWARPDVEVGPRAPKGAPARLGTALHGVAETTALPAGEDLDDEQLEEALRAALAQGTSEAATRHSLTPAQVDTLEEMAATWAAWWPEYLGDRQARKEVALAWDTDAWTARELPSNDPAGYATRIPSEVSATIDSIIIEPDAAVPLTVIDLKTGRGKQRSARVHAQLATGALCAARLLGLSPVRVVLAKVQPGAIIVDSAILDDVALDLRALMLEHYVLGIPTAEPLPGRHCSDLYCPALAVCEGPRALAVRAPELARLLPVLVESEADAAMALSIAKPLQAYVDGLRRGAVAWAEAHGGVVRMPDGSSMVRVEVARRSIDPTRPALQALLRGRFGEERYAGLVKSKVTISVGALERAASKDAPRGTKKEATVAFMRDVEATGALKIATHSAWEGEEAPTAEGGIE